MKTLGYCVAVAALLFLWTNGGEQASTTTWALSLCGIITSLVLLVRSENRQY